MYDSLYRNLSPWSVISNESSLRMKSDTMNREINRALIDFYKVLATGMDHAYECMRYIEKYKGKLPISFEELRASTFMD